MRNKTILNTIPNNCPGYYKWWAKESELDVILSALEADKADILECLEKKDHLYCIYVGIAAKESIRARLNWHVNDKHTDSRVKSGTLSTLRQSISSVVAHDQYNKAETDAYIDKLFIEWFSVDEQIGSEEAKEILANTERNLMREHLFVLNIQDNSHPKAQLIKAKLKQLRKESK